MKALVKAVHRRYGQWMDRWENDLCFRATDRVVRPFEYGLEWTRNWPCARDFPYGGGDPEAYLIELNRRAIDSSAEFFAYQPPTDFRLDREVLEFTSPVETPYSTNNRAAALWFPARNGHRKAVVLLPHWNARIPQHNALCRGLQRLGISTLRLSLPYHDARMPEGLNRADYAVSANICRTIDATRQAVIDSRACLDWLTGQGFSRLGNCRDQPCGSCYAFLASAHDPRIQSPTSSSITARPILPIRCGKASRRATSARASKAKPTWTRSASCGFASLLRFTKRSSAPKKNGLSLFTPAMTLRSRSTCPVK